MHAWRGQISDYPICDRSTPEGYAFCTAVGGHAFSLDAEHWYISPVAAYTPLVEYEDGTKLHLRARERPFLLIDPETGEATHLINGAGDPCMPNDPCAIPCDMGADPAHPCLPHGCSGNIGCPGADHSFTLIQPLKRDSGRTGPPAALNWHWRQQIHPIPAVANSKDASGIVFTPSDGYWHVMMDCAGGYSGDFGGWGHQRSKDLLHWEEMPLALGLDPSDPCQPLGLDTGSIAILPDGRPFAVYGTFNQSSKFGPRQVFDGNICMAVATNSSMTEWKRVGSIIDNPVCSACSPSCPSCTYENPKDSKGKPCSPLPPREGCTSPIPDMIPQFGFRDPSTPYLAPCSEGATAMCWFLTVGSGTQTNRSAAGLLYRSRSETDVTSQWSFVSAVIVENEYGSCGSNQYQYSCPDWFELGSSGPTDNATNSSSGNSSWVWMSLQSGCNRPNVYFTGQLNEASHKFVPSVATPLFHGDYQYFGHSIAKSGGGPDGRRLLWGAVMGLPQSGIPNRRSSIANASAIHIGGTMSLGQELSMAPEASAHRGTLEFRFLRELEALRTGPTMPADAASGRLLEIKAVITVSGANSRDADGGSGLSMFSGCVQLRYDPTHHELVFSGNATGSVAVYRAVPLTLAPGEALRLHVYVDGSVVEAIANDRSPISLIVTPPTGKEFEAVDVIGEVALPGGLQVWALSPTVEFDTPPAFKSDDGDLDDPIATYLKMGQQDDDDGSCTTELDCQLNGECVRGQCVCDAAWSGNKNCSTLALLPAKVDNGYGGVGSKSSSWGAGVDFEPKSQKWIMGISDYNLQCGQMSLDPNQRCGLAVSDTPDGPYIRTRTMVDSYLLRPILV
jgi:sucrose-6-phosphate hydrolase SacC (GH32 family)